MTNCDYCSEFNGDPPSTLIEAGMPYPRILAQDDDFVLMPTVGCITEGYLILSPKDHFYSFAELDFGMLRKLPEIARRVIRELKVMYAAEVLIAEHGSTYCETGAACCSHAHLHFIPLEQGELEEVWLDYCSAGLLDRMEICDVSRLRSFKSKPYVLFSKDAEKFAVWHEPDSDRRFGSQFCRKLVATRVDPNKQMWNWRTHPFFENMRGTLDTLTHRISFEGLVG